MAEELEDAEFWLPSEFLAEDSSREDGSESFNWGGPCNGYSFPTEFPLDWVSPTGTSSPGVESCPTEAESEEDGFFSVRHVSVPFYQYAAEEGKVLASSPQSTLWEGPGSELESPISPLKSRPPSDLVCEAASRLARIRLDGGGERHKTQKKQSLCPNPSDSTAPTTTTASAWSSPIPVPVLQKSQVTSKQRGAWGKHGKGALNEGARCYGGGAGGPLGLPSSAWPPLNQSQKPEDPPQSQSQSQSGTPAASVGGPAATAPRESYGGTGVFLPRNNQLNNRSHFRKKKSSCTPVLLPARVVEALKLDLDENGSIRRMPHAIILDHDAIAAHNMTLLHKRGLLPRSAATSAANQETARLPQEWTY